MQPSKDLETYTSLRKKILRRAGRELAFNRYRLLVRKDEKDGDGW